MIENQQTHTIRISVMIKHLNLSVRFPCSLTFAIKHNTNILDHPQLHPLKNGRCDVSSSLEMDIDVPFNRGKYEETRVSLIVYMVSVNGKIPAGSVNINPAESVAAQRKMNLQKCPDKTAQIFFTQSYQVIKTNTNHSKGAQLPLSMQPDMVFTFQKGEPNSQDNGIQRSLSSSYIAKNLSQKQINSQIKDTSLERSRRTVTGMRKDKHVYINVLRTEEEKGTPSQAKIKLEEYNKKYGAMKTSTQLDGHDGRLSRVSKVSSHLIEGKQDEIQQQKLKILKLEQQKTNYIKEIAKLKASLSAQQKQMMEQELIRISNQKDELDDQLEKYKEKVKSMERKQKQYISALKQHRQELEKKKGKLSLVQNNKIQLEAQTNEKDKFIHTLQTKIKQLDQSLQQEKMISASNVKKLELKQNVYRQQMKKLTEKYSQSQSERQKITLTYDSLLSDLESNEKKGQLSFREKQRFFTEQKNKLTRKLEQQTQQILILTEEIEEKNKNISQLNATNKMSQTNERQLSTKVSQLQTLSQSLSISKRKLQQTVDQLQSELHQFQRISGEDKSTFKKKYQDTVTELQSARQKIQKLSISNMNLEQKIATIESTLQSNNKEKSSLNLKYHDLKKIFQIHKKQEEERDRLAQTLSVQNVSSTQKINDLRTRLEQEMWKFKTMESKYEEQVEYLSKSKEFMNGQIQELKWAIDKEREKCQIIGTKNKSLNQEILRLNQMNMEKQQKFKHSNEQIEETRLKIVILEQQLKDYQRKDKQYVQKIKQKELEYFQIQKRLKAAQQESFIFREKAKQSEEYFKQKINQFEILDKEKQVKIRHLEEDLYRNNQQISDQQSELMALNQQIMNKSKEQVHFRQVIHNKEIDYAALSTKYQKIFEQHQSKESMIKELSQKLSSKNIKFSSDWKQFQKLRGSFEAYKADTTRAVEKLLDEFAKIPDARKKINLEPFPDERLTLIQNQALKKRDTAFAKHFSEIKQKQEQLRNLQNQVLKYKNQLSLKEEEHQEQMKKQTQRYKILEQDRILQKQFYSTNLQNSEEKLLQIQGQIDYLNRQINKYEQTVEEQQVLIRRYKHDFQQTKVENGALEQALFQLKEHLINNTQGTGQANQLLKDKHKSLNQKYKETVNEYEKKIKDMHKEIHDKTEICKQFEIHQNSMQREIQKLKGKEEQLKAKIERIEGRSLSLEKEIKEKEKQLKIQSENYVKASEALVNQIRKTNYFEQELKQSKLSITNLQQYIQKLQQQLSTKETKIEQIDKRQKDVTNKHQNLNEKTLKQIVQLKDKIIELNSQVQLKHFLLQDHLKKAKEQQYAKEQLIRDLTKKKDDIIRISNQKEQLSAEMLRIQNENSNLLSERQSLINQTYELKSQLVYLQNSISSLHNNEQVVDSKQREIIKLKQEIFIKQQHFESVFADLKNSISDYKKEMSNRASKEDEHKRRIRELELILDDINYDLDTEKEKWEQTAIHQRQELLDKIDQIQMANTMLKEQLQFQKEQYDKQQQSTQTLSNNLNDAIKQRDDKIDYLQNVINQHEIRIQELTFQLSECLAKWQKQKETYLPTQNQLKDINGEIDRFNRYLSELDGRSKQLLQISKRKVNQPIQNKPTLTQTLKQLMVVINKNKNKLLARYTTDKEKEGVIAEFKPLQQKIEGIMKSAQAVIKIDK